MADGGTGAHICACGALPGSHSPRVGPLCGPPSRGITSLTTADANTLAMDRRRRRLMWVRFLRRTLPVVAGVVMAGVVGQVAWRALVTVAAKTPVVSESSV